MGVKLRSTLDRRDIKKIGILMRTPTSIYTTPPPTAKTPPFHNLKLGQ